ncbi:MAG: class I SAM-dependent methyltransferase, partial [Planctomycetota bacterium]|nr:class I SAM-dependent methyltransferase [Planctomycetota bacterium]
PVDPSARTPAEITVGGPLVKFLDRLLQRWRIRKVLPYIAHGCRLLDVGCAAGPLRYAAPCVAEYVGIDSGVEEPAQTGNALFFRGWFPDDLPKLPPFDVITMLAVLEHIPEEKQADVAEACFRLLTPGGHLLITTPSPVVDDILAVLKFLRLVDGIAIEQHYGFKPSRTPGIFSAVGFTLVEWSRFQFGVNHLFVFRKPKTDSP